MAGRDVLLLAGALLMLSLGECQAQPSPLPSSPFFFDDTRNGAVNTDAGMGFSSDENWAKVDLDDKLPAGTIYGFEYLQYAGGDFSIDIYNGNDTNLSHAASHRISGGTANNSSYQFVCLAPDDQIDVMADAMYGVSADDKDDTSPPKWGRVYMKVNAANMPVTEQDQYPCGEHIHRATAHRVVKLDTNTPAPDTEHPVDSTNIHYARLAVRPIMDPNFRYTCSCANDEDCQEHDCNMACVATQCGCKAGWRYHTQSNLCVMEVAAANVTMISTDPNGAGDASVIVDGSYDTCISTGLESSPWVVIDLGSSMDVYGVNIKIPEPTAPASITTFSDENNDTTAVVYYPTASWMLDTTPPIVEKIVSTGPWPILLTASGTDGATVLLQRDLNNLTETFTSSGFGTIGSDVVKIEIIEHVGYIKKDTMCITRDVDAAKGVVAADNNTNCHVVYISGDATNGYVIKSLQDSDQLSFGGITNDLPAEFGSTTTKFLFHDGSGTASTDPLSSILADKFVLALKSNVGSTCVNIEDPSVTLSVDQAGECNSATLSFEFHPAMLGSSSAASYQIKTNTDLSDGDSITFDGTNNTDPCVEIVSAGGDDQGASVKSRNGQQEMAMNTFSMDGANLKTLTSPLSISVTATATVLGISDFMISVGDTTSVYGAAGFNQACTSFRGYPKHGDYDNLFSCDTVQTGRYVAVHTPHASPITICEISVLAKTTEQGTYCETDEDCSCPSSATADQHYGCNLVNNTCGCLSGYFYWRPSERCINIDECLDNSANLCNANETVDGVVDGVCKDLLGEYTCECPDGYAVDLENNIRGCVDIDETQINNCGCEGTCTNMFVDRDGIKYNCSCDESPYDGGRYKLADDNHSCEDVNECDDVMYTDKCDAGQGPGAGTCINFGGGYSCGCPPSLKWDAVNETCVDEDRCVAADCGTTAGTAGTDPMYPGECRNFFDAGVWECDCVDGYEFIDSTIGCQDVDECTLPGTDPRVHNCEQNCQNVIAGYNCTCNEGYYLDSNNASCVDINECDEAERTTHGITDFRCQYNDTDSDGSTSNPLCENMDGSYTCSCDAGYVFRGTSTNSDPYRCDDINECDVNNGGCEGGCTNTNMIDDGKMYNCTCDDGLKLSANMHSCEDIDECSGMDDIVHDCNSGSTNATESAADDVPQATCRNVYGSYECYCPAEWTFNKDTRVCEASDERIDCTTRPICEQMCINETATCGCYDGFELLNDERGCKDIDECVTGDHNCSQVCVNEEGTFQCACEPGYELAPDNTTCNNVNECETNNGRCQHNCTDNEGSYECSCKDTHFLMPDNESCDDLDECIKDIDNNCTEICVNQVGGFTCGCNAGYEIMNDAISCTNVDECDTKNGGCEEICTDSDGSYACSCGPGLTLSDNLHSCTDIDECASFPCEQLCVNTVGSFLCICDGAYRLTSSNDRQCVLGQMVRMELCYDLPYKDVYENFAADETRKLAEDIEDYMQETVAEGSGLAEEDNIDYQVTRFFKCPGDKVGVNIAALPHDDLSDAELAVLASDISKALPVVPFAFNGQTVELTDDPEFLYSDGTTTRRFEVDAPCDYYKNLNYCQNEGTCVNVNAQPECRCPNAYSGPRCLETSTAGLTNTEIGMIAGFAALLLLLALLSLCLCCWMRRRNTYAQQPEYYEDQAPSIMYTEQPAYAYNAYGNGMYGFFNPYK